MFRLIPPDDAVSHCLVDSKICQTWNWLSNDNFVPMFVVLITRIFCNFFVGIFTKCSFQECADLISFWLSKNFSISSNKNISGFFSLDDVSIEIIFWLLFIARLFGWLIFRTLSYIFAVLYNCCPFNFVFIGFLEGILPTCKLLHSMF